MRTALMRAHGCSADAAYAADESHIRAAIARFATPRDVISVLPRYATRRLR